MFKGKQEQRRYHVTVRRNKNEQWSEWNTTNDYDNVLKQIEAIEGEGWQAKVKERGVGKIYETDICD